ncbi:hypothetical protein FRC14_006562 [Serendipita sp. 396]|nr:hypothetical protein FRC14_006562 [Serendipita sp. 396]KAG8772114.1 hypothetical protein FRC15_002973 [Serendipita sp. 397]KAG8780635.1 hypothetical protein FRC16_003070 [Serendipita sp. 398]KAG8844635.1 hypothetical protein FRB91_002448 [Serendipita sp. 411]KAG8852406.1 hypothetical protein FRC20_001520 [Serendipita sp. 405]
MASDGGPWAGRNANRHEVMGSNTWIAQEYKMDPAKHYPFRSRLRATSSCSSYSETSIGASSGTDGVYSRPESAIGFNEGVWDRIAADEMDAESRGEADDDEGQQGTTDQHDYDEEANGLKQTDRTRPLYITPTITLREAIVRFIGLIIFTRIIAPDPPSPSSSYSSILWTAFSQLLLSMVLPEVLWVIRTAHRTRTVVFLHLAWKLYTVLHCTQLAAMVAILTPGWMMVSRMATRKVSTLSRDPKDANHHTYLDQAAASPTPALEPQNATFRRAILLILAPLANVIIALARRLLLFFVVALSAILFCTFCALYPHIQNPFALGCVFCTCTVVGLRIRDVVTANTQSFNCAGVRTSVSASNDEGGHRGKEMLNFPSIPISQLYPILPQIETIRTESPTRASPQLLQSLDDGYMQFNWNHRFLFPRKFIILEAPKAIVRLVLSSIAYALLTTAWCAWLMIMGDIHPELALVLLLDIIHRWKRY